MPDYPLRRIDEELWRRVKAQAAKEGRPVRFVMLELIRIYADHGFQIVELFDTFPKKK